MLIWNKVLSFGFVFILDGFDLIRFKVGPVGNRHVKITLHVISMLHIHTRSKSFSYISTRDHVRLSCALYAAAKTPLILVLIC